MDGREVATSDFPRYDNEFARAGWRDETVEIRSPGGYTVSINFGRNEISFD